jgi:environmental stress-induced protein Ves
MSDLPRLVRLDPARYRRTPWKNGGGITVDIADRYHPGAEPGGWTGLVWRLGRTRIELPAPFSDLPGIDRILTVISGRGLVLRSETGAVVDARQPLHPVRFPGEWPIRSEIEAGPVEVLNLMADRSAVRIDVRIVQRPEQLALPPAELVFYAPGAAAALRLDGVALDLPEGAAIQLRTETVTQVDWVSGLIAIAIIEPRAGAPDGGSVG